MNAHRLWLPLLLLPAIANAAPPPKESVNQNFVVNSEGFLAAHPDIRWRGEGMLALEAGNLELAAGYFQRAARFGDKPSQAMYADMLWRGEGVAQDRPRAYAWMDLAAERMYKPFLAKRELYWNQLDKAQQDAALEIGRAIYAEYGDDVAKPRLETLLRREGRNIAGSRTGSVGALQIRIPGPGGIWHTVSGEEYYARRFWEPAEYWAWTDQTWKDPPSGRVDVRPIEKVEEKGDGVPAARTP